MVTVSMIASLVGVGILIVAGIVLVIRYSRLIPKLKAARREKVESVSRCESDTVTTDDNQQSPQFLTSPVSPPPRDHVPNNQNLLPTTV